MPRWNWETAARRLYDLKMRDTGTAWKTAMMYAQHAIHSATVTHRTFRVRRARSQSASSSASSMREDAFSSRPCRLYWPSRRWRTWNLTNGGSWVVFVLREALKVLIGFAGCCE